MGCCNIVNKGNSKRYYNSKYYCDIKRCNFEYYNAKYCESCCNAGFDTEYRY